MNEAADAASNLPAILLLWLWWALLSAFDIATRGRDGAEEGPPARAAHDADPGAIDERFAAILRLDPAFSLDAFLTGARRAYETILQAYAAADIETLRPLLSPDVLAAFEEACADRQRRGESVEFTLIGIDAVEVVSVEAGAEAMEVTLCFRSQSIWTERDAGGVVIGGDPESVATTVQTWTFARPVPVRSPSWVLVATCVTEE